MLLTSLQFDLLRSRHGDKATETLRLPLLLVDLGAELVRLATQPLGIGFEGDKLVSPEIRLGHEEVETPRKSTNLGLKIIAGVYKGSGALAD